jgi:PIN domain nuclease of toxin-antitoxin system
MVAGVADTHAAIWFLFGDARLSTAAKTFFDNAARERRTIALSSTLAEVMYFIEKRRLPISAFDDLRAAISNPNHVLKEAPFTADGADAMRRIPRDEVPDMPDRNVSATAVLLRVPLITRDGRIRTSSMQTIW